jgi:hypothetical protein
MTRPDLGSRKRKRSEKFQKWGVYPIAPGSTWGKIDFYILGMAGFSEDKTK